MRLSLQLYTVRNNLAEDVVGTMQAIRDIGYEYVELAGGYGMADEEWRSLLDRLGLKASGTHVGIDGLEQSLEKAIQSAKTFGTDTIIVPWLPESRRSDWAGFGKQLEQIARLLREHGITLAYHNHDFEFRDGGLETLFESTDPDLVKSELDVAWVQIGGADPVAWIRKLSNRLPLVHLKDFDPERDPIWQPAGQGRVNFDDVLAACREAGVRYGAVELDLYAANPLDAARISYEFFAARGVA